MSKMARAWLRSCVIYATTCRETYTRALATHAQDTHEAVLRLYATLGESVLTHTVLERVHCHQALLVEMNRVGMCVAWLDERRVERLHLRLKLLFQASQRCGGFKTRRENIRDTLEAMMANSAVLDKALLEANARVDVENAKSGLTGQVIKRLWYR